MASSGGYSGDELESRSGGGDDRLDSDLSDKPIYLLEHLATFTVNKDTGIVYPSDGMRRLLQLEKTTGIWSQKMQLCLDNQWILIMDYETGNIIERFPASLIQEPTAFTSNNPMEMYNNILVFIVAGGSGSRSEMHIFQSQSISAVHLVEDLKQLRNGKIVTQHRETIPLPPMRQSRGEYSAARTQQQQQQQQQSTVVLAPAAATTDETDSELGGVNDETSSTSSDKYERDVTVLNHCFDDIEKFIARLQHAAAASRELERRRRNRKSKKKDPGEGLLTLRTRPPHEKEFIDIFAKFKLSFNLLAKLKAHIHDPNAPELVHFLFTPLALIVEASSDTYYESHLPSHVINPLLTREAVNLLINCVTSKETELWRSLGDAWTLPRDQWKGHVGSYHPVFFDGWSPDYPVVDELEYPSTPTNQKRHVVENFSRMEAAQASNGADFDYDGVQSEKYMHSHHNSQDILSQQDHNAGGGGGIGTGGGFRDFSARSDISIDSIERNGITIERNGGGGGNVNNSSAAIQSLVGGMQNMGGIGGVIVGGGGRDQDQDTEIWLDKLQSRGAKIVQVTYPRTANNDKELTVVRGEYLEILDDSRKWWKARNSRGQTAHVPHTIVTPFAYGNNNDGFNNTMYSQQNYAKGGRQNESDSQIGVGSGGVQNSAEWVRNKHIGNYNDCDDPNYNHQQGRSIPSAPIPPPPPPPPQQQQHYTSSLDRSRTSSYSSNSSTLRSIKSERSFSDMDNASQNTLTGGNIMQEELKQALTMFREKRRNLKVIRTPEIYIQELSQPREIEQWLQLKGFSERSRKILSGLNGNQLFQLKRANLEDLCGPDEGKRLASQITIQRNVSGYKTTRSSELLAILARARQKSEPHPAAENTYEENQHEENEQHGHEQQQQQQHSEAVTITSNGIEKFT